VKNNPKPRKILTERQLELIELYGYCQLGMTPKNFRDKWSFTNEQIAFICERATPTVGSWFCRGRSYRRPKKADLRHLALMDFLLEHYEDIPVKLRDLLCPPRRDK
jgi:hypothetical protein